MLIRGLSNLGNFQTAFIPFITAGDPDLATTSKALKILDSCGSDVIEVGVPYSDPLADGPVIQVGGDGLFLHQPQHILFHIAFYSFVNFTSFPGICNTCT